MWIISLSVFSLLAAVVGTALVTRPGAMIELQRKFYENINWRIEPISMRKELRNTMLMGLVVLIVMIVLGAYGFMLFKKG